MHANAQDGSEWLVDGAPSLSKVTDLSDNTPLPTNNVDCDYESYLPPGEQVVRTRCTFGSPLGTLTTDGDIEISTDKLAALHGPDLQSYFLPTTDSSIAMLEVPSPGIGNYLGIYRHLSRAAMEKHVTVNAGTYYQVPIAPDGMLRDPVTNELIEVDTSSVAYSANGDWMVVNLPHRGILRVSMADFSTQLFARPIEPQSYIGLASPALAVSDDGRYVAANTDVFGGGNIILYDTSTCSDQLDVAMSQQQYCAGKDIWHGLTLDGQSMGRGMLAEQSDMIRPTYLRFVNDDSLSFDAQYAVISGTEYKAASFVATAPGIAQHKLGLLGLGDSYISGQGAFDYRDGTDTSNNGCHLSLLSYPFILGTKDFDAYNSIACSGATTDKIVGDDKNFEGQVLDNIPESKRDKDAILTNFLPGYIYQQEFASTYQPEAMLLSAGGDDVGFADIVKSCVANEGGGTCYDNYEDRAELLGEIDDTYAKLVNTYTTLRQQSGGARLYVVGYPQIAKPGGACGLNVHLNEEEVEFSAQLIDYLDSVVRQAAQTAGVFYVDTQQAFDGHRLCESGDSAMNGFTVGHDAGITLLGRYITFIGTESYHPTALGHQLLADTIAAKTDDLTAPMPAPGSYAEPTFDAGLPILQAVPSSGRPTNRVQNDDTIADDVVLRGSTQPVHVDGTAVQLQPGSGYQVVLHSDAVLLDEGGVDADGNIATTVRIPADTVPGYHVLHVYGTDMAGEPVDVQKVLYVAASADDYDGDGVPNDANPCLLVPLSGKDSDGDGIDDACDPDITATPVVGKVGTITAQASTSVGIANTDSAGNDSQNIGDSRADTQTAVLAAVGPDGELSPVPQAPAAEPQDVPLYNVNWIPVLGGGMVLTAVLTAAYRLLARAK
ncbi:MAG: SGNH/GDSL hydrolase family protein [Candidatus Saccharibacteria bacterium]